MTLLYRMPAKERLALVLPFRDARVSLVVERRKSGRQVITGDVVSVAEVNRGQTHDVIVLRGPGSLDVAVSLASLVSIERVMEAPNAAQF